VHNKKLVLISNDRFNELVNAASSLKSSNKQFENLNKKVVKENLAYLKEVKALKERLASSQDELNSIKEQGSKRLFQTGLLENNSKSDSSEIEGMAATIEQLQKGTKEAETKYIQSTIM
jgi:hypothetical protein